MVFKYLSWNWLAYGLHAVIEERLTRLYSYSEDSKNKFNMDSLFDKNFDLITKSLDMYLLRHQVTADNIANAETPSYKARRVEFEGELQRAVNNADAGVESLENAVSSVSAVIFEDPLSEVGQDLNTVDMDREMAQMTKNDIKYSAATEAISKKFSLLKYAIQEGGGGGGGG